MHDSGRSSADPGAEFGARPGDATSSDGRPAGALLAQHWRTWRAVSPSMTPPTLAAGHVDGSCIQCCPTLISAARMPLRASLGRRQESVNPRV